MFILDQYSVLVSVRLNGLATAVPWRSQRRLVWSHTVQCHAMLQAAQLLHQPREFVGVVIDVRELERTFKAIDTARNGAPA